MKLSSRVENLKPSPTLAITAKAKQMCAEGIDVIGFGAGEPDFPTPAHIVDAAVEALRAGDTRYTAVGGTPALKKAVAASIARDYGGISYGPAEITASCGAKHTLYNLFMALIDEGDEVVIPAPYWVSYPEQVELCGGKPVIAQTREEDGFLLSAEALDAAITPRTKAFVLNSPSNPTGGMYDRGSLAALAEVIRGRDLIVVSDDIYQKLTYGDRRFVSILEVAPDLRDRVVIVNGVSKSYAMTGWRLGYAAGPRPLITAMENMQSQSTSNPTSFVQAAAARALTADQGCIAEMVKVFERRRDTIAAGLNAIPGVRCSVPPGAFYVFPNVGELYGAAAGDRVIRSSLDLAGYLLDAARVAVIPGAPFGADAYIRLSYATSDAAIAEGVKRMTEAIGKLGFDGC